MKKRLWIVLALLALTPVGANALEFGVQGAYWYPDFSADVSVDGGGIDGTEFSLENEMDVDKEGFPSLRAYVGIGSHHLSLAAMQIKYEGSSDVRSKPISFAGFTIPATGRADFTLEYTMVDAEYRWDLIDLENVLAGFSLGPVLGAKLFDGYAEVTAAGNNEKEDFTAVAPLIGAAVHIGILADLLEAQVTVKGIGYSGNRLIDGAAEISFTPFPFLDIAAGYRLIDLDVDYDDVSLDVSQAGPYVALGVGF
jgi:hypothetical protein